MTDNIMDDKLYVIEKSFEDCVNGLVTKSICELMELRLNNSFSCKETPGEWVTNLSLTQSNEKDLYEVKIVIQEKDIYEGIALFGYKKFVEKLIKQYCILVYDSVLDYKIKLACSDNNTIEDDIIENVDYDTN